MKCECGNKAEFLCDYSFVHLDGFYRSSRIKTCDKPLCDNCKVSQGKIFMSGKSHDIDSIDYCKHHHERLKTEKMYGIKPEKRNLFLEKIK